MWPSHRSTLYIRVSFELHTFFVPLKKKIRKGMWHSRDCDLEAHATQVSSIMVELEFMMGACY
jgi:hypothetical protein